MLNRDTVRTFTYGAAVQTIKIIPFSEKIRWLLYTRLKMLMRNIGRSVLHMHLGQELSPVIGTLYKPAHQKILWCQLLCAYSARQGPIESTASV
jgi:hypothetical protein